MINNTQFSCDNPQSYIVEEMDFSKYVVVVWDKARRIGHLAIRDDDQDLDFFDGKFVEGPSPSVPYPEEERYNFKHDGRCLDITRDPGPFTELLEKIGFIFFKIDVNRLRKSSPDVQAALMTGLFEHHYFAYEQDPPEFDIAAKVLPGFTAQETHHFLLLDKSTGSVAGAIFSKRKDSKIKLDSVVISEEYRDQGIGSLFLQSAIRRMQADTKCTKFTLFSDPQVFNWYKSYGFTQDHLASECPSGSGMCQHYTLSFTNQVQNNAFIQRELQLPNAVEQLYSDTPLDLLAAWPLEHTPFPLRTMSADNESLVNLYNAAEDRAVLELLKKALVSAPYIDDSIKKRFAFIACTLEEIRTSLRRTKKELKTIQDSVPPFLDPGYISASPHLQPRPSPHFTIKAGTTYDLRRYWNFTTLTREITDVTSKINQLKDVSEQKIVGACELPSRLSLQAHILQKRLERFLPLTHAKIGTVFTYIDRAGNKTEYQKLSSSCFGTIYNF